MCVGWVCVCVCVCVYVTGIHWMHGSVASTHCAAKEDMCSTSAGGEPRPAEDLRMQLSQVGSGNFGGALMTSGSFTMMGSQGMFEEEVVPQQTAAAVPQAVEMDTRSSLDATLTQSNTASGSGAVDPSQCFLAVTRHRMEPETTEHGVGAAGGETTAQLKTLHTSPPMACETACTVDEGTVAFTAVQGFSNGETELPPETFLCIGQTPAAGE